jgi:hypothetical protein
MATFIKIIFLGILTALAAVIAEQMLAVLVNIFWQREIVFSYYGQLGIFLVIAAVIEEGFKYLAIVSIIRKKINLYGLKLCLGSLALGFFFGLTEILLIFISNENLASGRALDSSVIFSLVTVVLLQSLAALLAGSMIASRIFSGKLSVLKIIFFPVLIHLLYNFLVIQKSNFTDWLVGIILGITLVISLVIIVFNFRELD